MTFLGRRLAGARPSLAVRVGALLGIPVLCGFAFWIGAATAPQADAHDVDDEPLTAIVEAVAPTSNLTLDGTLERRSSIVVVWSGEVGIVTALHVEVGDRVERGKTVAEINGRPAILLSGILPAYRDLRPGAVGPDVAQLTSALVSLGYLSVPTDTYTSDVANAVRAMYEGAGYPAPTASSELETQLKAAREELRAAKMSMPTEGSHLDQQVARDRAERAANLAGERLASLQSDLAVARAELQSAIDGSEPSSPEWDQANRSMRTFETDSRSALQDAEEAVKIAAENLALSVDALADAATPRAASEELIAAAEQRVNAAKELADTPLPKNEVVFAPAGAERITGLYVGLGEKVVGDVLTIGEDSLVVQLEASAQQPLPREGDFALVAGPQGQIVRDAAVASVVSRTETRVYIEVVVPADAELNEGDAVSVAIPVASPETDAFETVPRSAVVAETDGRLYLDVIDDAKIRRVEIQEVGATAGTISVKAADGSTLVGREVLIHSASSE